MASVMQSRNDTAYTFSSQPRVVQTKRKKYRDPLYQNDECPPTYGNIMFDKRVIRGNTYGQRVIPTHAQPDPIEIQRQQEARRRAAARRRAQQQLRPHTPDPIEGRKHIDVQTELYLEELSDRIEEADIDCQTDAFLDRPPTPLFIPAKSGVDVETEIECGDLFDFDIEVRPILEVLVGKTVEQSLLEVMQEEELMDLRKQQREFEELRNAELMEQQRLEEQERRRREEKERRMKQQQEILAKEKETADKIAAQIFSQGYLQDLVPSVFGTLADYGYFYDPVERDVEQGFLPWMMDVIEYDLDGQARARMVLDGMIYELVHERNARFAYMDELLKKTLKPIEDENIGDGEKGLGAVSKEADVVASSGGVSVPEIKLREPTEVDEAKEEETVVEEEGGEGGGE